MGRGLLHALAVLLALGAGILLADRLGGGALAGGAAGAAGYLLLRAAGRDASLAWCRRLLVRRSRLAGPARARFAAALEMLDRGHPDVARAALLPLYEADPDDRALRDAWLRSCLRLAAHRRHGEGDPGAWAGATAREEPPLPFLERALLAPALATDRRLVAEEAASVRDDGVLEYLLTTRTFLAKALIPAVGRPWHPMFAGAERDLEVLLGRRHLLFPERPLWLRALAFSGGGRPLPPREETAALLLATGQEGAAEALLAAGDAAGTLGRRGRALRIAAGMVGLLRSGGVALTPALFAARTREVFLLQPREAAALDGSAHLEALGDGPRRLLALLDERRRFVAALAGMAARRGPLAEAVGPLLRRVAEAPVPGTRAPSHPRVLLRWWRAGGRELDRGLRRNLEGLVALRSGDAERAASLFEAALAFDPGLAAAAYNLAVAAGEAGRDGDPAAALRSLARERDDPVVWHLLGEALERLDRPGEAAEAYRRAADRAPGQPEALVALGRVQQEQGDTDAAEETLRRALRHGGARPEPRVALAVLHLESGRPGDAVPLLREAEGALDGEPRDEVRFLLHCALRDSDEYEGALAALEKVPDRFLRRREHMLEDAAMFLEEQGRFDRSQRLFARLREIRARRGEM